MKSKNLIIQIILIISILTLAGCDIFSELFFDKKTLTITYFSNGASIGSVPVDSKKYSPGDTISALGNTGFLALIGFSFAGWNTSADGSGLTICAGGSAIIGTSSIQLFAIWIPINFGYHYGGNSIEIIESNPIIGDLIIPGGVTSIGYQAFSGKDEIVTIQIPSSIERIDSYAFYENENLSTLSFQDNSKLSVVGDLAFFRAQKLKEINFPLQLSVIGSGAFAQTGISKIRIPASIKSIESGAFSDCANLMEVFFLGDKPPKVGSKIYGDTVPSGFKIYVPLKSYAAYCASWPGLASLITTF